MHAVAQSPPAPDSPEILTAEFQAWLSDGGVRVTGVRAAFVAEGWRGIVATENIEPGDMNP